MTNQIIREACSVIDNLQDSRLVDLLERLVRAYASALQELKNANRYRAPRVAKEPPLEIIIKILETWDSLPAWIRGDKTLTSRVMSNAIARCFNITPQQMRKFQCQKQKYYKEYYGYRKVEYPSQARLSDNVSEIVTVIGPPELIHNIYWSPAVNGSREPVFIQTESYLFFPIGIDDYVDGKVVVRQSKKLP